MWPQQSSVKRTDDPELVTDSAAGQPVTRPYTHGFPPGLAYTEEQQWKSIRGQPEFGGHIVSRDVSSPTCMKGYSDSGKGQSLYDSGRTDSGFLSGHNIVSDQCLSDEGSSRRFTDSAFHDSSELKEESKSYMRLDSGVDVGLNDEFSQLNLKSSINNLNVSSKSHHASVSFSNINVVPQYPSTQVQQYQHRPTQDQQHQQSTYSTSNLEWYLEQDEDGDTQLHIAIIKGFIEGVYSLVRMVPHPCFLDILNDLCQTPLHLAVLTHQPRIARLLLIAGSTVDLRDRHGNTALHLASEHGDLECVKALMEPVTVSETIGANLRYTNAFLQHVPQNLEERNYDGQMCVHLAALGGHVEVLRHLVWLGANINSREGKSGRTALHYAVERRNRRVAQFLLDECNLLQLEATTYAGYTAYQLASCVDTTLAQALVSRGADQRDLPDSDIDTDSSDEEMFHKSDDYFKDLRINGEPIDVSA